MLTRPPDDHPHDAWAIGGDLEPGTLLSGYRLGVFPMPVGGRVAWWSPLRRGVVPLDGYTPSRSVRRAARGYAIRVDTAFGEVIRGCADPERANGWIDEDVVRAYTALHELGWAHSIEAWDDVGLAGGLYGVGVGGLFAAESMYHRRSGASKAALHALVELLARAGGPRLLDVQWARPALLPLGVTEISRADYHGRLADALRLPDAFAG